MPGEREPAWAGECWGGRWPVGVARDGGNQ